jgi:hypothetical protein
MEPCKTPDLSDSPSPVAGGEFAVLHARQAAGVCTHCTEDWVGALSEASVLVV